jgi:hypothetical protein
MRVHFEKSEDGRRCSWWAELSKHRRVPGSTMGARAAGTDLPHDLAQLVVEAELRLEHGFWNLVANGATFESIGRRRTTPGRQLIAAYRAELNQVERLVNEHVQAWRDGRPTPVGPALNAMAVRWRAWPRGAELDLEWPTRRLPRPRPAAGHAPLRRRPGPR